MNTEAGITLEQWLHIVKHQFVARTFMDEELAQAHLDADPPYYKEAYELGWSPDDVVSDDISMWEE